MFFPSLPPVRTPSPPSSSSSSSSIYSHKLTSFETARGPPFVAYKIRHHQVPQVHKALSEIIPDFGDAECHPKQHMIKATRHDTQVLFATQDCADADRPQEAILLSLGRGAKMQVFHANKPVCEGLSWFKWTETTAETLGLQKIELPHTFFREDLAWMLRAHASRECCQVPATWIFADETTGARGLQEHMGDTHLINRVERYFADIVFVFRRRVWAKNPGEQHISVCT